MCETVTMTGRAHQGERTVEVGMINYLQFRSTNTNAIEFQDPVDIHQHLLQDLTRHKSAILSAHHPRKDRKLQGGKANMFLDRITEHLPPNTANPFIPRTVVVPTMISSVEEFLGTAAESLNRDTTNASKGTIRHSYQEEMNSMTDLRVMVAVQPLTLLLPPMGGDAMMTTTTPNKCTILKEPKDHHQVVLTIGEGLTSSYLMAVCTKNLLLHPQLGNTLVVIYNLQELRLGLMARPSQ
mmetsp:Transcript_3567/g.5309  ORF Transcript_3567/g.5309 Transcript_3567/m.5309 type:complete len:239 (-) Transcript_3567:782-1498(-)